MNRVRGLVEAVSYQPAPTVLRRGQPAPTGFSGLSACVQGRHSRRLEDAHQKTRDWQSSQDCQSSIHSLSALAPAPRPNPFARRRGERRSRGAVQVSAAVRVPFFRTSASLEHAADSTDAWARALVVGHVAGASGVGARPAGFGTSIWDHAVVVKGEFVERSRSRPRPASACQPGVLNPFPRRRGFPRRLPSRDLPPRPVAATIALPTAHRCSVTR